MSSRPHIAYLSFDGILSPLGYSQVARVVMKMAARRDQRFTIVSLERGRDRRRDGAERGLERTLRRHHVRWRRARWSDQGGVVDVIKNIRAMESMLSELIDEARPDLIHARSYVAASVARRLGDIHRIPYLFDTRGFWVDERIERNRWFTGPVRRRLARIWENRLYEDADAAVMLTEVAADEIRTNSSSPWTAHRPLRVIPTCVDYGEFGLGGSGSDAGEISESLASKLDASLVVGFVGSINRAYHIEASIRLFDHVLARRPDAHLLCLTRNPPALRSYLRNNDLSEQSYTVETAPHHRMPAYLRHIDWGLLLRNETDDQRAYLAAMPTKLAEFFAAGVRPVHWGKNPEVRRWIEYAGSGHVMDDIDEAALRRAADVIAKAPRCMHTLWGARWRTRNHFGLQQGVKRYRDVYDAVLSKPSRPRMKVLCLTEGTTVPASRFRIRQLVPHLRQRGIDCTVRAAYGDGYNRWSDTAVGPVYKLACRLQRIPFCADAHRFDAVILQRPALPFSALAEQMANWRNPHTIFDVDDAIFTGDDGDIDPRRLQAFESIVRRCAHVICGNEHLAEKTRHLSPTSVIPTVVDTEVYRPSSSIPDSSSPPLVVGWMGTPSNFDSLQMIAPVLETLIDQFDGLCVRIVSSRRFEPLAGVDGVEQLVWKKESEVRHLQSFDIGIMPLLDNPVTRGKCGFKAIQYMAVGIPVVASAVGANCQILQGQKGGILAEDASEFESALRRLIVDDQARRRMGNVGRIRVQNRYSVRAVIDRYVQLLEAVGRRSDRIDDDVDAPNLEVRRTSA